MHKGKEKGEGREGKEKERTIGTESTKEKSKIIVDIKGKLSSKYIITNNLVRIFTFLGTSITCLNLLTCFFDDISRGLRVGIQKHCSQNIFRSKAHPLSQE